MACNNSPSISAATPLHEFTRWRVRPHPSCSLSVGKTVASRSGKPALLGRATGLPALV